MPIITWLIERLAVAMKSDGLEKVVVTAHWRVNAIDKDGHRATACGTATFGAPDPDAFKQFDDLQPDEVLGWVWASGVDKDAYEASLARQIADQINPPIVFLPPPWEQTVDAVIAPVQAPAVEPVTDAAPAVTSGE